MDIIPTCTSHFQPCRRLRYLCESTGSSRLAPSVHTPFPPTPDTPLPPDEYVYPEYTDSDDECDTENPDDDLVVPMIQVGPPMSRAKFKRVVAIAKRIVEDPENMRLDTSECPHQTCPYSRVGLMEQRFTLMRRLFQLNSLLPYDHTAGLSQHFQNHDRSAPSEIL